MYFPLLENNWSSYVSFTAIYDNTYDISLGEFNISYFFMFFISSLTVSTFYTHYSAYRKCHIYKHSHIKHLYFLNYIFQYMLAHKNSKMYKFNLNETETFVRCWIILDINKRMV